MLSFYQKRRLTSYHIESRMKRLLTRDGYDFAFIPKHMKPPTAGWRYDEARKRHNIVINEELDLHADRTTPGSGSALQFAMRVYDHEGAHSLFTERDSKKMKKMGSEAEVPFHLWNLFEDARIEAKWRKLMKRRFHWMRYVLWNHERRLLKPMPDPSEPAPENAINLFLDCTHSENSPKMLNTWCAKDPNPKIQFEGKGKAKYYRRAIVRWYYRKAIKKSSIVDLLPLIQSWLKTFPETRAGEGEPGEGEGYAVAIGGMVGGADMPDPDKAGEGGEGEMPAGARDADGSEHKEIKETLVSASAPGADSDAADSKKGEKEDYVGESKVYDIPRAPFFFSASRVRCSDWTRADRLVRLFEKFLEGGEDMTTSRNPTGKINFAKLLRGAEDFYIRKGDDPYGVKKISFIMDVSGSMSGEIGDGVYLAYVLNELVRRRKIECKNMILSGGPNHAVPMPFDHRILDHIRTPGAIEGFENTMRQHEKELVSTDLTIFFTDGDITDEHIKRAEWHRKGVYSIGLYVGSPDKSGQLHRWFDSVLVRKDIEAVADGLIQLIKR